MSGLTLRIFFVTSLILFASSAVTYLIIALSAPSTYGTVISSRFELNTEAFPEESLPLTGDNMSVSIITDMEKLQTKNLSVTMYSELMIAALSDILPTLFVSMLAFSFLCALFYSRYISRLSASLSRLQKEHSALMMDIEQERALEQQRTAFFSAASHELKTPVTVLKGQLNGMLDGVGVYRNRDKYLAKALGVTSRMEGLIQEILTISRMENSRMEPCLQPVELCGLIRHQLEEIEDLITYKELQLSISLPDTAVIPADPPLIRKVLGNLLSNAVFYAPENAVIFLSVSPCSSYVELLVENSGSHIPEDALPHVFEPFFRADNSRSRSTGGSGLGLYIVQIILKLHHAWYQIENTEDGVRFTIRFPVSADL